ncbi:hypothetical protein [Wolbachia endosymbiont of Wuchereria bancrofti]|uniref:hypothetical protein n=1 Tax=Wolbachia endosymbiont of Wuchereria bancrofti TaxID=96496 RepID=UPI000B4D7DD9|nr:hypothetical protein [Wolbachia endosymbiont of Wuchereria bancrofti]OWZ25760.1 hypothetical protein CCY16_00791 [Wolbachia endosymbiont of Wuchereria bancrofti]
MFIEHIKDLDIDFNSEYEFAHNLVINGKVITNDFIKNLYSKYENLIPKDRGEKGNYRLFLKAGFHRMFVRAGATAPNNSIMEELITYYNRSGYMRFPSLQDLLYPFGLRMYSLEFLTPFYKERIYMDCKGPNCWNLVLA